VGTLILLKAMTFDINMEIEKEIGPITKPVETLMLRR
jgi:hypothetical protein